MPDEIAKALQLDPADVHDLWALLGLLARLSLAFVLGCVVAWVYRLTYQGETAPTGLVPTLVMLAVLIALVTEVIGGSLARAFGLVGALSIVRFRTVVEDTRDTAFVIFAVAVGMAVGAKLLVGAMVGTVAGAVTALLVRPRRPAVKPASAEWVLTVRLGLGQTQEALEGVLQKRLEAPQVYAVSTARQGAAIEITYRSRLRADASPTALVAELNRVEGVQQVELRRG